ncbi:hypothetical protein PROFUN_15377 [Planoprotostelium fungivorum]|uniref:Uncharacterized protein n=1 Tax=Planoprotostelium fungivorum TaxID=1890364 RepID=A0A2P6MWS8_9EUKA|nr:hypothetical protein PROFUN_15377 [Planoprotostelium fungivorum]
MDLYQPLTSDEDLHLSPFEKEAVLREINRRPQLEAAQVFGDQYIGSWKFESHTWRDFAEYLFQREMKKTTRILTIISSFLLAIGLVMLIVLMVNARQLMSVGVIFSISMGPILFVILLLITVFGCAALYSRYRR